MKVYVDELPEDCIECPCESENYCNLMNEYVDCILCEKRHQDCPLQSLADYTKQVRKELIDKLAIFLIATFSKDAEFSVEEILNWLQEVKDQIQGE